jgi:hypothetical protein
MAKVNWNQYSATPASNTDIDSVNIDEGCPPSGINNAIREVMAHTADVVAGTVALSTINIDGGAIDGVTLGTNSAVTQAVIDNVNINGSTIGHTSDTDLLTVASGALTVAGDVTLNAQADMRFADADSSNWVAFQAPATVASNVTWTLPNADATTSGQVLSSDAAGALSWADAGGGKVLQIVSGAAPIVAGQLLRLSSTTGRYGVELCRSRRAQPQAVRFLSSSVSIAYQQARGESSRCGIQLRCAVATRPGINYSPDRPTSTIGMGNSFLPVHLDSPSTTSATTYKSQFKRIDQSGTVQAQRNDASGNSQSVILALEIGA